jgi:5'-deoxynucleotidase YfbR-like HD superfamily hydrolase
MAEKMKWEKLINFFDEANQLKKVKRQGWVVENIESPETVAEHTFRTALMCMFLGKNKKLDMEKVLKMALVHDIAEAKIGDIITYWRYEKAAPKEEKLKKEREAIQKMVSDLGDKEIFDLWDEFDGLKTKEAKFVRQVEKLEMSLQALEYEKEGQNLKGHYHRQTEETIEDPELMEFFKEMLLVMKKKR